MQIIMQPCGNQARQIATDKLHKLLHKECEKDVFSCFGDINNPKREKKATFLV